MFSTPSTNQTRTFRKPTTRLGRWATAQKSRPLHIHVHTTPCSGVQPHQTPEKKRDHATVETETRDSKRVFMINSENRTASSRFFASGCLYMIFTTLQLALTFRSFGRESLLIYGSMPGFCTPYMMTMFDFLYIFRSVWHIEVS